jgi:hypothetical protein
MPPVGLAATVVQTGPPIPVTEEGTTVTEAVFDGQHPVSQGMPEMRSAAVGQILPQAGPSQFGVHFESNVVGLAGHGPTVEHPPSVIVVASGRAASIFASPLGDALSIDESMIPPLPTTTSTPGAPPLPSKAPESRVGPGAQKPAVQVWAAEQPLVPQVPRQIPGSFEAPAQVAT